MEVKDYLGNLIQEGDEVVYLGQDKTYKKGIVQSFKKFSRYGRSEIRVGVKNLKYPNPGVGYTFPERCINLRFVHFQGKLIPTT